MASTVNNTNLQRPAIRPGADQLVLSAPKAAPEATAAPEANPLTLDTILERPLDETLNQLGSEEDLLTLQKALQMTAATAPDQGTRAKAKAKYAELSKEMKDLAEPGGVGAKMLEMFVGVPRDWVATDGQGHTFIDKSKIMGSLPDAIKSNTLFQSPMGIGMQAMQEGANYAQGQMSAKRYVGDFISQGVGNWGLWGAGSVLGAAALGAAGLPLVAVAAGGLLTGMLAGGVYDRTIGPSVSNWLTKHIPSPIANFFKPIGRFFGKHPMLPMAVMGALMLPMVLANPVMGIAVIGGQLLLQPKINDFLNKIWKKNPDMTLPVDQAGPHAEYADQNTGVFYHLEPVTDASGKTTMTKVPDAIAVGDGTVLVMRLQSKPDGSVSLVPKQVSVADWRKVDENGHYVMPYGNLTSDGVKALWDAFNQVLNGNSSSGPAPQQTKQPGRR